MSNSRWYVLQVLTGEEHEVEKQLKVRGVQTLIPIENRIIRRGGKWITEQYTVFPGYVFVKIEYSYGLYYTLSGIRNVIKILGGGNRPIPLTHAEANNIIGISELIRKPSTLKFDLNGDYTVVDGALKGIKIIKMRRRQRRAIAEVELMGRKHEITLSFNEIQTQESKGVDSSAGVELPT